MSTFEKCNVCFYCSNQNFNQATEHTKCQPGHHIFTRFVLCKVCHHAIRYELALSASYCSINCRDIYDHNQSLKPKKNFKCGICGKDSNSIGRCSECEDAILKTQREEKRQKFKTELDTFAEFKNCSKGGVCDIVKAHHNILKNDPERLKSSFIIEMVCGAGGKDFYLERKKARENKC